jgi:trehalose 6-phosphate synthase
VSGAPRFVMVLVVGLALVACDALAAALTLSPEEQRDRMRSMRAFLGEFNVYRWAGRMLVDAARLRSRDPLTYRLTDHLAAAEASP